MWKAEDQYPVFVVNLDRAPRRWQAVSADLDRLGLAYERVAARDRLAPGAEALWAGFADGRAGRDHPATLGDVCCTLTHQALWRRIAALDAPAAVVLEDDARPAPALAALLRGDLGGLMRRHGIGALKLEHWPGGERSRRHPYGARLETVDLGAAGKTVLYRQAGTFLGTCAYAITPEAASRLLAAFPRAGMPVDHFLFSPAAARGFPILRPAFLNPAPVLHDFPAMGSDLLDGRIAAGLSSAPQSWRRRLREALLRRRIARAVRRGRVERVAMAWAGDGTLAEGSR